VTSEPRLTKAALIGLLIGAVIMLAASAGPLVSATLMTIGVETQVGAATGLPDPRMLPAALEGLGAVALVYILTLRAAGRMRAWCVFLIGATLVAGMAAQGSHALWYDERAQSLVLPWQVKLLVSFVPPLSGAAALHLVVTMAEGVIGAIRLLQELPAVPAELDQPSRPRLVREPCRPAVTTMRTAKRRTSGIRRHGSRLVPRCAAS
jgi:hypothetical protein